jgi:hypothetical protein
LQKKRERQRVVPITPTNIRVDGVALDEEDRADIRRRTRTLFGRYGAVVERVTVRIRDVNGPRGGVDIVCRIKVVLSSLPSVVAERRTARLETSFRAALAAAASSVSHALRRRRMVPIKAKRQARTRAPRSSSK